MVAQYNETQRFERCHISFNAVSVPPSESSSFVGASSDSSSLTFASFARSSSLESKVLFVVPTQLAFASMILLMLVSLLLL